MTEAPAMDLTGIGDGGDRGPWMQTFHGHKFYVLDPRPLDVDPRDISIALGNLCRYTGHVAGFYSVAQHCVLAADKALHEHRDEPLARIMLMHDATEAYLGDMSRPLKSVMPDYRSIEEAVWAAIAERFGMPVEMPAAVKQIDNELLALEKASLLPNAGEWPGVPQVDPWLRMVWNPQLAAHAWWKKFGELFPNDMVFKPVN